MDCDLHYIELKRIFPSCSDSFFNAGWKEGFEGSAEACTSNLWLCCRKGMYIVLYVQEVVTLQEKCLIYLHQKMRVTTFINYYDTLD